MDPLSVSMAIVGLLSASLKISDVLSPLISKGKNAPAELRDLKQTVDTIRAVLSQLQLMLLGRMKVTRERTSLILVDQIVVTLSACVSTFSDLDVFVETLGSDEKLGLMNRMRWATKAPTIQEHMTKLEAHKASMTLMVTILTCDSTYKAEDAVDELSTTIKILLDSNRRIAERLASIEIRMGIDSSHGQPFDPIIEPETVVRNAAGFAFEEELENSWVYKRSIARDPGGAFSVISSAGRTASWSMLSGLSLSDSISIIAVQALPLYAFDISNSQLYQFGEFEDNQETLLPPDRRSQNTSSDVKPGRKSFRSRLVKIAATFSPKDSKTNALEAMEIEPHRVFGSDLRQSITFANVAISLVDSEGNSYIYGYVPIVVAKCGVYLKEKGTTVENILYQSGSAKRIFELQTIFNSPDRYGKGLDWLQYTVHDAASLLLRYLKTLPQSVIPFDHYEQFVSCLEENDETRDPMTSISAFQKSTIDLPPLSRQLLLYLLDLLAVFASKSDENHMTSTRLVAVFQPSLLSKEPQSMTAEDHERAALVMVFMVENQDHFLIGMTGTTAATETSGPEEEKTSQENENAKELPKSTKSP
ncbi:Rho GTPase activation protein [Leptodontidium sp. MPI-SDFR-AT-0119]|nr:Rho GTPase activation protein [Leptodontidium sp. MPI-SDFR-AT-0119]